MLGGVCVLASDSGGPLEIINDNSSGLLFKTFQSCDLAEKLKYLYLDPDLRKKLASNGYEKALKDFNAPIQFLRLKQEVYDLFAKKNLNC
jgi:glycosyltransferase involved in cell wall biosynthesis